RRVSADRWPRGCREPPLLRLPLSGYGTAVIAFRRSAVRTAWPPHGASLHRHAKPVRREDALAHAVDAAGAAAGDADRRGACRADHLHPLYPGPRSRRAAGSLAALLPP